MPGESYRREFNMYLVFTGMPGESYRREFMYLVFTGMPGESYRREFNVYLVFISMPGESYRRRLGSFCHSFYQRVDLNPKALIHEPLQSSGAV